MYNIVIISNYVSVLVYLHVLSVRSSSNNSLNQTKAKAKKTQVHNKFSLCIYLSHAQSHKHSMMKMDIECEAVIR